jgi:hypothetical protein
LVDVGELSCSPFFFCLSRFKKESRFEFLHKLSHSGARLNSCVRELIKDLAKKRRYVEALSSWQDEREALSGKRREAARGERRREESLRRPSIRTPIYRGQPTLPSHTAAGLRKSGASHLD